MIQRWQKILLSLLIPLVSVSSFVGSLVISITPANAQITIIESIPDKTKGILDTIWGIIKNVVLNAVVRLVSYTMRKIAYDGAVWLASGGHGQTPFAQTKTFGAYLKNVGDDAFGIAMEQLNAGVGMNLCKIPDIKTDLALKVGLRLQLPSIQGQPSTAKGPCSFSDFQKNWLDGDVWKSKFNSTQQNLTEQFNKAISDPTQSDFGIQLGATNFLNQQVGQTMVGQQLQRLEGQGYLPKTAPIDNNRVESTAGLMKKEFESNTPGDQQRKDEATIGNLLSSGNIQVLPTILSIFLNTLAGTMVKNYQEHGILPFGLCSGTSGGEHCKDQGGLAGAYDSVGDIGGRRAAQDLFSGFLAVVVNPTDNYDLLGKLESCPESPELYNCRADSDLIQAARQGEGGAPLTIQEALDQKLLHGDWQLIPPSRAAENMDQKFCSKAYCYSNLKVLRQVRLLPLGFEIAAKLSDPDKPWTLEQVTKGFNDCARDQSGKIVYDPIHKPFCHLIDPSWVIRTYPVRCDAYVPGPEPLAQGSPDRLEECVDLKTCVAYNSDGSCNDFAYCTREKNTWKFNADTCDAQFRTCRSFNDANGSTVAYLYRTLDTGYCNADNAGCTFYSLDKYKVSGQWQKPGVDLVTGAGAGIFFNSKLTSSCSANSAGCTAFQVASSTATVLYLKKAPNYSLCYDVDPKTQAIDWPKTPSDLSKLDSRPGCDKFSAACIPQEVGCTWYHPLSGGAADVPGKITADNLCDAKCVGYDAYREMPSNYSSGAEVAYIVPSSGKTCTQNDAGCSGFTNLSTNNGGVEQVDYFSYLRPCVPADKDKGKTFITYESSLSGFQLKTYQLVANTEDESPYQQKGQPRYFYRTAEDLQSYFDICNEAIYKNNKASPDCRQFTDDQGKIYYRLLSKTIPVSNSCTPYRLNNTELYPLPNVQDKKECTEVQKGNWDVSDPNNPVCQVCFQGGEYRDGQCFYYGLAGGVDNSAGQSRTCSAAVDTCREYKGNSANNTKDIVQNDYFENSSITDALKWWGPNPGIIVAPESTNVKGHSLGFTGVGKLARTVTTTIGRSYRLTFWAKGSGNGQALNIQVALEDGKNFTKQFGNAALNNSWQLFDMGPLELVDPSGQLDTNNLLLTFSNQVGGTFYIDNVRLVEFTDYLYLVKKSLSVDSACDADLNDNLPGAALGCSAYQDTITKNRINLTGFDFLCREKAIGCTAVFDTQNTLSGDKVTASDQGAQIYNLFLPGTAGTDAKLIVNGKESGSCHVDNGRSGCYAFTKDPLKDVTMNDFKDIAVSNDGQIKPIDPTKSVVASTVYIPPDTAVNSPIFLVANKEATCNQVDLGCVDAGRQELTPNGVRYTTTTIKNDPATYKETLCQQEALACNAYSTGAGNIYFKDPSVTGQKICSYKTKVKMKDKQGNEIEASGWFWKGVGQCAAGGGYCSSDNDCTPATNGSCQNIGNLPCYPNYLENNSNFGLWSYGTAGKYDNFVGECPAEQDSCSEFADHNDIDDNGDVRKYYFLKNSKISQGDCAGQASLKKGCALFDQTDNPNKFWHTTSTYMASDAVDGNVVAPISKQDYNDANILIKVARDRTCGEWLQCSSSHVVQDPLTGKVKNVCDTIGRCDKAPDTNEKSDLTSCAHWVEESDSSNKVFSEASYVSRSVGWAGDEYDGLSILNSYPLEELGQLNTNPTSSAPSWHLVKEVPCGGKNSIGGPNVCVVSSQTSNSSACRPAEEIPGCGGAGEFPVPCNPPVACGTGVMPGVCINGTCIQNINGITNGVRESAPRQICRAYPEKNSPFPNTPETVRGAQQFSGVNFCSESKNASSLTSLSSLCECDYTKANFNDVITKYWSYNFPNKVNPIGTAGQIPPGICQGGKNNGQKCEINADCQGGACELLKSENKFLGWRGYCVEEDISRPLNGRRDMHPCLTWLPVDNLTGSADINNQHVEAGYVPPAKGGRLYCVNSNGGAVDVSQAPQLNDLKKQYVNYYAYDAGSITLSSSDNKASGKENSEWTVDSGNWGQFLRTWVNAAGDQQKIYLPDIDKIIFTVNSDEQDDDPKQGTAFEVWPNMYVKDKPQVYYIVHEKGGAGGRAITGFFNNKNNEIILAYGSRGGGADDYYVREDGRFNDGSGGVVGNIFTGLKYGNTPLPDGVWNHIDEDTLVKSSAPVPVSEICPKNKSGDGNWHLMRLRFHSKTLQFVGFDTAYCDDSSFNGTIVYNVVFQMKEWCKAVADVNLDYTANKTAAPATNILWDKLKPPVALNGIKLENNSFYRDVFLPPFGSLDMPNINPDSQTVLTPAPKPDLANVQHCDLSQSDPKNDKLYDCVYNIDFNTWPLATVGATFGCKGPWKGCAINDGTNFYRAIGANSFDLAGSQNNFKFLFARPSAVSGFDIVSRKYLSHNQPDGAPYWYDFTEEGKPPRVHPVGLCNAQDKCLELNQNGISLNGTSTGNVYLFGSNKKATLRFYAYADGNQMPLREVNINWGDVPTIPGSGEYRNHRGVVNSTCNKSSNTCQGPNGDILGSDGLPLKCTGANSDCPQIGFCRNEEAASNFGEIADRTCDSNYFQFDHVFTCTKDSEHNYQSSPSACGKPDLFPNGCCVFTPHVQVKDNWGWCNGSCNHNGKNNNGEGCYDGSPTLKNECITDPRAWTNFGNGNGKVYVAPK